MACSIGHGGTTVVLWRLRGAVLAHRTRHDDFMALEGSHGGSVVQHIACHGGTMKAPWCRHSILSPPWHRRGVTMPRRRRHGATILPSWGIDPAMVATRRLHGGAVADLQRRGAVMALGGRHGGIIKPS